VTTWNLLDPPGPEVRQVEDGIGVLWTRDSDDDDLWWGDIGNGGDDRRYWCNLWRRRPLTAKEN
jgi:hypothetical protein